MYTNITYDAARKAYDKWSCENRFDFLVSKSLQVFEE